jgi:hypothetical protein
LFRKCARKLAIGYLKVFLSGVTLTASLNLPRAN